MLRACWRSFENTPVRSTTGASRCLPRIGGATDLGGVDCEQDCDVGHDEQSARDLSLCG